MSVEDGQQSKRQRPDFLGWPAKWSAEETFWRDVASGALAVALGGFLAIALGAALGYLTVGKHLLGIGTIYLWLFASGIGAGIGLAQLKKVPKLVRRLIRTLGWLLFGAAWVEIVLAIIHLVQDQ